MRKASSSKPTRTPSANKTSNQQSAKKVQKVDAKLKVGTVKEEFKANADARAAGEVKDVINPFETQNWRQTYLQ